MKPDAAVRNVASVLDNWEPNWWQRVDFDVLSMVSSRRCVMGQVFGDFRSTPHYVRRTAGFVVATCAGADSLMFHRRSVVAAWRAEVEERAQANKRAAQKALADRRQRDLAMRLTRRYRLAPASSVDSLERELVGV